MLNNKDPIIDSYSNANIIYSLRLYEKLRLHLFFTFCLLGNYKLALIP